MSNFNGESSEEQSGERIVAVHPTGHGERLKLGVASQVDSKRSQQHNKTVSWMRKTEYISGELDHHYGVNSNRGQRENKPIQSRPRLNLFKDKEIQIGAIEKCFSEAFRPIKKHHSKPGVHAVEEISLFPNASLVEQHSCYAQVSFKDNSKGSGKH